MTRPKKLETAIRALIGIAAAGALFGASCAGVSEKLVKNVNPCGTILNCDPVEYDLLFADYPDWDVDPTCTIPSLCGGTFPYRPGAGGAAE